jgi:Uma2 family endonuclease
MRGTILRDRAAREPDVMFIAAANQGRIEHRFLNGPADLVIEVVSDESVGRDRGEKFYEYEDAGAVKTQPSAKTMAFDPKTKRLFLSAADTV